MRETVPEMMRLCRNHFAWARYQGRVEAAGGVMTVPQPLDGITWLAIAGAGVFPVDDVPDLHLENGVVWELCPPQAFLRLCADMKAWREKGGVIAERFGDYSVSLSPTAEERALRDRVSCWRHMFNDVEDVD